MNGNDQPPKKVNYCIMNLKLGIVLSGGGVRGMAHIGLLKALREFGIEPDYISGASAGALVGALYAADYTSEEMLDFFKKTPIFQFSFYSISKPGLLDIEKYEIFFGEYFPNNDFKALRKRLFITTTDIAKAEIHYFSEGELIRPLLASAAIPPIFTPVEINGRYHSDGGIMNNFPIEPIESICDRIIGCNVSPATKRNNEDLKTSYQIFWRSTELTYHSQNMHKLPLCDFLLEPSELVEFNIMDTRYIDKAFEIGYQRAVEALEVLSKQPNARLPLQARQNIEKPLLSDLNP